MKTNAFELVTDRELLEQAKAGDQHAFEQLVKRYESQVAATVIGMLGHTAVADDVGQEVFVRFYKALHGFRHDAKLGTYLTRIAINLSLNELKRRKRRRFLFQQPEDLNGAPAYDLDDAVHRQEARQLITYALQKLDPKFRAVIVLRLIDGYSTEETASILDVPMGTVLSRLSRAQAKMKEILMPLMQEEA